MAVMSVSIVFFILPIIFFFLCQSVSKPTADFSRINLNEKKFYQNRNNTRKPAVFMFSLANRHVENLDELNGSVYVDVKDLENGKNGSLSLTDDDKTNGKAGFTDSYDKGGVEEELVENQEGDIVATTTTKKIPQEGDGPWINDLTWDDATWILTASFIIFTMQTGK